MIVDDDVRLRKESGEAVRDPELLGRGLTLRADDALRAHLTCANGPELGIWDISHVSSAVDDPRSDRRFSGLILMEPAN